MNTISNALSMLPPPSSRTESAGLPTQWVERVFDRLRLQFGERMADALDARNVEAVKAEWSDALAGYSAQELARGLKACQQRAFPPVLGEFCRLCRPALDAEWAFNEAAEGMRARDRGQVGEWSHPAVFRAACALSVEVRTQPFAAVRRRWTFVLERELASGWGEDVPAPAPRLRDEARRGPPSPEVRARIAAILGRAA